MTDRVDVSVAAGGQTRARYALTVVNGSGVTVPRDLTDAGVVVRVRAGSVDVLPDVTVPAPATAGVVVVTFDGDDLADGVWTYQLEVTDDGAEDFDVPVAGAVAVTDYLDPNLLAMRAIVGWSIPPTDAELLDAFARLGSAKAAVLEYLQRLLLEIARQPTSWAVQGYSESWGGSIAALKAFVDRLRAEVDTEAGAGPGVLGVSLLTRGASRR